jgi:hypothetical protein
VSDDDIARALAPRSFKHAPDSAEVKKAARACADQSSTVIVERTDAYSQGLTPASVIYSHHLDTRDWARYAIDAAFGHPRFGAGVPAGRAWTCIHVNRRGANNARPGFVTPILAQSSHASAVDMAHPEGIHVYVHAYEKCTVVFSPKDHILSVRRVDYGEDGGQSVGHPGPRVTTYVTIGLSPGCCVGFKCTDFYVSNSLADKHDEPVAVSLVYIPVRVDDTVGEGPDQAVVVIDEEDDEVPATPQRQPAHQKTVLETPKLPKSSRAIVGTPVRVTQDEIDERDMEKKHTEADEIARKKKESDEAEAARQKKAAADAEAEEAARQKKAAADAEAEEAARQKKAAEEEEAAEAARKKKATEEAELKKKAASGADETPRELPAEEEEEDDDVQIIEPDKKKKKDKTLKKKKKKEGKHKAKKSKIEKKKKKEEEEESDEDSSSSSSSSSDEEERDRKRKKPEKKKKKKGATSSAEPEAEKKQKAAPAPQPLPPPPPPAKSQSAEEVAATEAALLAAFDGEDVTGQPSAAPSRPKKGKKGRKDGGASLPDLPAYRAPVEELLEEAKKAFVSEAVLDALIKEAATLQIQPDGMRGGSTPVIIGSLRVNRGQAPYFPQFFCDSVDHFDDGFASGPSTTVAPEMIARVRASALSAPVPKSIIRLAHELHTSQPPDRQKPVGKIIGELAKVSAMGLKPDTVPGLPELLASEGKDTPLVQYRASILQEPMRVVRDPSCTIVTSNKNELGIAIGLWGEAKEHIARSTPLACAIMEEKDMFPSMFGQLTCKSQLVDGQPPSAEVVARALTEEERGSKKKPQVGARLKIPSCAGLDENPALWFKADKSEADEWANNPVIGLLVRFAGVVESNAAPSPKQAEPAPFPTTEKEFIKLIAELEDGKKKHNPCILEDLAVTAEASGRPGPFSASAVRIVHDLGMGAGMQSPTGGKINPRLMASVTNRRRAVSIASALRGLFHDLFAMYSGATSAHDARAVLRLFCRYWLQAALGIDNPSFAESTKKLQHTLGHLRFALDVLRKIRVIQDWTTPIPGTQSKPTAVECVRSWLASAIVEISATGVVLSQVAPHLARLRESIIAERKTKKQKKEALNADMEDEGVAVRGDDEEEEEDGREVGEEESDGEAFFSHNTPKKNGGKMAMAKADEKRRAEIIAASASIPREEEDESSEEEGPEEDEEDEGEEGSESVSEDE